jgi:hypothetical protein
MHPVNALCLSARKKDRPEEHFITSLIWATEPCPLSNGRVIKIVYSHVVEEAYFECGAYEIIL